jgi:hypothetical protein
MCSLPLLFLLPTRYALRPTNSPKLNATTPPTTFTPPECMHIRHSPPSLETQPPKTSQIANERFSENERTHPPFKTHPAYHPGAKIWIPLVASNPRKIDNPRERRKEREFGTSGKRRLVFLLIINCFFAFVLISCAYFSASLLHTLSIHSHTFFCTEENVSKEGRARQWHGMAWHGVDPDLGPID